MENAKQVIKFLNDVNCGGYDDLPPFVQTVLKGVGIKHFSYFKTVNDVVFTRYLERTARNQLTFEVYKFVRTRSDDLITITGMERANFEVSEAKSIEDLELFAHLFVDRYISLSPRALVPTKDITAGTAAIVRLFEDRSLPDGQQPRKDKMYFFNEDGTLSDKVSRAGFMDDVD